MSYVEVMEGIRRSSPILDAEPEPAPPNYNYLTRGARTAPWMIVDIETTGRDDVAYLLETPEPSKTLKDPDKIAAEIAAKTNERDGKLALDMNCNQIVAIGVLTESMDEPDVLMPSVSSEAQSLYEFWEFWCSDGSQGILKRALIGFNVRNFDVPILMQRTRLLGMPEPALDYGRYSKEIIDLAEILACGDPKYSGYAAMRRTLKNYCALFGIADAGADCGGSEVPELVAAGRLHEVEKHCAADIMRTRDLAVRLGVIK